MTALRRLPAASYDALKSGTRLLVDRLGGFEAAAGFTRVKPTRLHNYCDRHHPDDFAPIDVIADLQSVDRDAAALRPLASLIGYQVVVIEPGGQGCEAKAVAAVLRDAAELAASWAEAMEDASLSDAERGAIQQRLAELRQAVDQAMSMLSRQITTAGQRRLGLVG